MSREVGLKALSEAQEDQAQKKRKEISSETLWTIEEVASYLRLRPDTIRAMSRDGRLPGIRVGRVWRFKKSQIEKLVDTEN
ncbi:MAG: helix-turn-helix domain-containing protein [Bacteroidales bacterium]